MNKNIASALVGAHIILLALMGYMIVRHDLALAQLSQAQGADQKNWEELNKLLNSTAQQSTAPATGEVKK